MSKPLIDENGEVRELTEEDFKRMRPMRELHSDMPKRVRGPQNTPTKVPVSIRLSPKVVDYFKATGKGWQSRMDTILQDYVSSHEGK